VKPEYAEVENKRYKINTDFRVALECEKIAKDTSIGDYERSLAIIYKLFGKEGLHDSQAHEKLLELAIKYLKCGKDDEPASNEEPDMDYEQDRGYIKASFFSDYKVSDVFSVDYMHWWDFSDYMEGLTENSALSRVRFTRNYDESEIKDAKEREKVRKQKESVALKKKAKPLTDKQKESVNKFCERAGIKKTR
jgi:hypothetical protein